MKPILLTILCGALGGIAGLNGSVAPVGTSELGGITGWGGSAAAAGSAREGGSAGLPFGRIGATREGFSPGSAPEFQSDAADAAAKKFAFLKTNAAKPNPDRRPTIITENELNSYLASGKVKLPVGVRFVHFVGTPGVITGKSEIDFDAITAGKRSSNPLLSLFTGVHKIEASAHAEGEGGEAQIHVDAVSIDGTSVPSLAVEFFLEHYLKSKHPEAGLNPSFKMSQRIDAALVGEHMLVIIQK